MWLFPVRSSGFTGQAVPVVVGVISQASVFVGDSGYVPHVFVLFVCEGAEDFSCFPFMGYSAEPAFGVVAVFGEDSVGILNNCGPCQFVIAVMVLVARLYIP